MNKYSEKIMNKLVGYECRRNDCGKVLKSEKGRKSHITQVHTSLFSNYVTMVYGDAIVSELQERQERINGKIKKAKKNIKKIKEQEYKI